MKGSRTEWIILLVLLGVMAAAASLANLRVGKEAEELVPDPSSYNPGGSGSMGFYLWLQAMGARARRWERPLAELPGDATILWVLRPTVPLEELEVQALEDWVRGGGVLVLADDTVSVPIPGMWVGPLAGKFGLQSRPGERPARLLPAFPSPYVEGVEAIEPEGRIRFQRKGSEGWAPLFADGEGDVVAVNRLGRGVVIALADPGIFSNARIETAGHARLAVNIVRAHRGGGVVLVDEFHHGRGHQGALSRYFRGSALPWMIAQAALAFLVLVVARGTRFGPPVPPPREERASGLEYAVALGDLCERAGARRTAAEALAGSFRRTLAEALGASAGEDPARLAARGAARLGVTAEQVEGCLAPGQAVTASDPALLQFARIVHGLEGSLRRPGITARSRSV